MPFPQRKRLRLKSHDYSQEGCYFITICTKDKRRVLSEVASDGNNSSFVRLKPFGIIARSYLERIPGIERYVIMPNHIHMLIRKSNGKDISSDIRSFKGLTTKNIRESVWQTSYYDHVIRNDLDYAEKARYIDENPAKWNEDEYNS